LVLSNQEQRLGGRFISAALRTVGPLPIGRGPTGSGASYSLSPDESLSPWPAEESPLSVLPASVLPDGVVPDSVSSPPESPPDVPVSPAEPGSALFPVAQIGPTANFGR
jgi:hypothetical protein